MRTSCGKSAICGTIAARAWRVFGGGGVASASLVVPDVPVPPSEVDPEDILTAVLAPVLVGALELLELSQEQRTSAARARGVK